MSVCNSVSEPPALEARHLKAIDLLATGLTPAAVARELKVCDRTLRRWRRSPLFLEELRVATALFRDTVTVSLNHAAARFQKIDDKAMDLLDEALSEAKTLREKITVANAVLLNSSRLTGKVLQAQANDTRAELEFARRLRPRRPGGLGRSERMFPKSDREREAELNCSLGLSNDFLRDDDDNRRGQGPGVRGQGNSDEDEDDEDKGNRRGQGPGGRGQGNSDEDEDDEDKGNGRGQESGGRGEGNSDEDEDNAEKRTKADIGVVGKTPKKRTFADTAKKQVVASKGDDSVRRVSAPMSVPDASVSAPDRPDPDTPDTPRRDLNLTPIPEADINLQKISLELSPYIPIFWDWTPEWIRKMPAATIREMRQRIPLAYALWTLKHPISDHEMDPLRPAERAGHEFRYAVLRHVFANELRDASSAGKTSATSPAAG